MMKNRIRVAIQKSGRLTQQSLTFLNRCGIQFGEMSDELFSFSKNFPLELLRVRDDDIPALVMQGQCDFGIVGNNVLQESLLACQNAKQNELITVLAPLGFSSCRLAIAVPEKFSYKNWQCLSSKRIATSYPHLLQRFLKEKNINADVVELKGSIEIAPRLGMAEAICDLVATGKTLIANNLREVTTVMQSEALLIKTQRTMAIEKQQISLLLDEQVNNALKLSEAIL